MISSRLRCRPNADDPRVRPPAPPRGYMSGRNRRTWRPPELVVHESGGRTVSSPMTPNVRGAKTQCGTVRPVAPNVVLLHGVLTSGISRRVWKTTAAVTGSVFLNSEGSQAVVRCRTPPPSRLRGGHGLRPGVRASRCAAPFAYSVAGSDTKLSSTRRGRGTWLWFRLGRVDWGGIEELVG